MARRSLPLLLLVAAAPAEPAPTRTGPAPLPVKLAPTTSRRAIDHVVTYAYWRDWGPKWTDRVIVYRHRGLVRVETTYIGSRRPTESPRRTDFANLATAASLILTRSDDGSLREVTIERDGSNGEVVLSRTSAKETIGGERCAAWRAERCRYGVSISHTACITWEGIPLRETTLYGDGKIMEERRALRVERRRVRPAEVLPPKDALNWSTWAPRTGPRNGSVSNYEVVLEGTVRARRIIKVLRAAAGWYSEEELTAAGRRSFLVTSPVATLSSIDDDRRLLGIERAAEHSFLTLPNEFGSAPFVRPAEQIAGERCTWFDAALRVADYGREECRTRDGITLARREFARDSLVADLQAVTIRRGRTLATELAPPALLMTWSRWGWPDLDTAFVHRRSGHG